MEGSIKNFSHKNVTQLRLIHKQLLSVRILQIIIIFFFYGIFVFNYLIETSQDLQFSFLIF